MTEPGTAAFGKLLIEIACRSLRQLAPLKHDILATTSHRALAFQLPKLHDASINRCLLAVGHMCGLLTPQGRI